MASGYATMPLCLEGSWTEELQCVHTLPAMFGHHQVCGTLSMVKVVFFSGLCTGLFAEQKAARSLVIIELYCYTGNLQA